MAVMEGVLELVANVLVMGEIIVHVLVMGVLVLVADWLLVGGAPVVDVLIEHKVLADALHIGGNVLVVEAVVVSLQALVWSWVSWWRRNIHVHRWMIIKFE